MQINRAIIEAAIVGFEQQKRQIDETIAELRAQLNGSTGGEAGPKASVAYASSARKKREMSAEGRARIAAAQKKRWAEQKKQISVTSKPTRKISPAGKAKLVANLAKARAAKASNKAKAA
jgi:cell division septum initiation protein DivIVA